LILIQTPLDYYYLLFFFSLILENKLNKYNILCLNPYVIAKHNYDLREKFFFTNKLLNWLFYNIANFFLKFIWSIKIDKLYKTIGVNKIYRFDKKKLSSYFFKKKTQLIYSHLKSKKDVLKISYKKILIGDLIYDTYLRWRSKPTVDINDSYLKTIIFIAINIVENLEIFYKYNKIKFYISTFASYIHHGIPVRFFYKKKIKVYLSKPKLFQNNVTEITNHHYYNSFNFKSLKKEILQVNKNQFNLAKKSINNKFSGKLDITSSYLKFNPFAKTVYDSQIEELNGVIFLHDFFDSPHDYKFNLFPDFYEWAIFTFDLVQKYNLKVGIKPHPNMHKTSKDFINFLKLKYPRLIWIDHKVSNYYIFKQKNFKFGISVSGSVIYEMAYFNKIPIAIGENYFSSFSFMKKPKTKTEYKNSILKYNQIRLPLNIQDIVIKIYYKLMVEKKDDFICNKAKEITLKKMNFNSSKDLLKYSNMIV